MVPFLDLHTHYTRTINGAVAIQSLAISESVFLAMPKTKPISIGIHPWFSKADDFEKNMKYLRVLAQQSNVKMIGECGLDKLRGEPLDFQIKALTAQIQLAAALNKPVVLHCVKAFDELIALKKQLRPQVPLIIHGFNKNSALGSQLIQQGFYLSFGAAVLSSENVQKLLQEIGVNFFLETDDAEVSIESIYQKVAELKKTTVDELKDIIFANWRKIGLH
jgi:TatD DNase family protein